jgi:hypothetical protein
MKPKEVKSALLSLSSVVGVQLVSIDGRIHYLVTHPTEKRKVMLSEEAAIRKIEEESFVVKFPL